MDQSKHVLLVPGESVALEVNSNLIDEESEMIKWFEKTFSKKECNYFKPADPSRNQRCGCGLLQNEHTEEKHVAGEKASSTQGIVEYPTDAFGSVSFNAEQQDSSRGAEYVRLSDTTVPESVWHLLRNKWSLKPPTLILSILGDNTDDHIDINTKLFLEKGLAKILQMTDVWMLTGGTRTEVTKLIARLFQENYREDRSKKNACIGIAPWGCILEREQLQGQSQLSDVIYSASNNMAKENRLLEENHTHFLLVDNGTSGQLGTDRIFRSNLEHFLAYPEDNKPIPIVNLLINGGHNACLQVKENLRCHPSIPLVVLKGSGGLADVLVDALTAGEKLRKQDLGLHRGVGVELINNASDFAETNPEKLAKLREEVMEIVEENSNQIVIVDPKGDPFGLRHAIVEACKPSSSESLDRFNELLQLAIHLGENEMAAGDIERVTENAGYLEEIFYKCIKGGKEKFVEVLLNRDVNLKDFMAGNKKHLRKLYRSKLKLEDSHFKILLTDEEKSEFKEKNEFHLKIVDRLLHDLLEGDYTPCYGPPSSRVKLANNAYVEMSPAQEMIVWALFNNMPGMVDCFWKFETERALENALVIFRISKALMEKFESEEVEREDFKFLAREYEMRAVEMLEYFYRKHSKASVDIVKFRIPLWGFKNLVTLAANGVSTDFVAQTCCQAYLKDVWLGRCERKTIGSGQRRLKTKVRYPRKRSSSEVANVQKNRCKKDKKMDVNESKELPRSRRVANKLFSIPSFLFFVPKGKLYLHEFIFTFFLGCFAFLVLVKKGEYHESLRYVVCIIVTALTIDEIREIVEIQKGSMLLKLQEWIRSVWNKLDVIAMILFYVAFAFGYYDLKSAERNILAIDLVLWVIKFAQFYRMFYSLGPYLIMIYKMMFHMVGFVLVLIIAVVAYGIFMHTLLFPDVSVSWQILFKLLFRPYLLVFGELGINSYSLSNNSTVYGTQKISLSTEMIVVFGMCVYLLMANVLLLNMLIAVFNNIYEDIKENSDKIWKYDKYGMIMEFKNKSAIPIPLSVFSNIYRILFRLCRDESYKEYVQEEKDNLTDMREFQNKYARAFLQKSDEENVAFSENITVIERTQNLSKALEDLDIKMEMSFSELARKLADK